MALFSDCLKCSNFIDGEEDQLCCQAFPDGIPDEIFWNKTASNRDEICNDDIMFTAL